MTPHAESVAESSAAPGLGRRSLRVLVVDDERDQVLTLSTLLQQEGHLVEGAYRARDAMQAVKRFDPDLLLVDIALPDGSGYAVAEYARRRTGEQRPMIIALTGVYMRAPHDHLSRVVGCDHFLAKPCDFGELLRLIEPLTLQSGPAPR